MRVRSLTIRALGFMALANLLLCAAAAKANQAVYLENEASYCEIFHAINPDIPEECVKELGLSRDADLKTKGLLTRSIRIHETNEVNAPEIRPVEQADSTSEEDIAIALRVPFLFNSDQLTDDAKTILDKIAKVLNSELMLENSILIEGHADATGAMTYNRTLSERRAEAVLAYLVQEHLIVIDRLQATGKGEAEPYDPANPNAGINRRVEFTNLGS